MSDQRRRVTSTKGASTLTKSKSSTEIASQDPPATRRVAFRFHARALAALGRDLVTNDVVAVMELVKNAYDAMATRVVVRLRRGDGHRGISGIEIEDDGLGMDYETITDVWCVIATPFKRDRSASQVALRTRPVTGEKGLGRLSAARLGRRLEVVTQTATGPALRFSLNWDEMLRAEDLADQGFDVSQSLADSLETRHGTIVRIEDLSSTWTDKKIADLRANLARLVSPFATAEDFCLSLDTSDGEKESVLEIKAPAFMSVPKYALSGSVESNGSITAGYRYQPLSGSEGREKHLREPWRAVLDSVAPSSKQDLDKAGPGCGPFQFEIRAWDLTTDDTRDIAQLFSEKRRQIRRAISSQRGISVYRDDILVLPKSEGARDWLGLDLRRVSRVGRRLSTSQLVGYVRITKADNPEIRDTSDREGLVSSPATVAFQALIRRIVALLEEQRQSDRIQDADTGTPENLFEDLSAEGLIEEMEGLRDREDAIGAAISLAKDHARKLERSRAAITRRFGYYSRLAVIGTIAQMVIHEIRNRTVVIGRALRKAGKLAEQLADSTAERAVNLANESVGALDGLATRFAPLAKRGYRSGRRTSFVEESIERCLAMQSEDLRLSRIAVAPRPRTRTAARIDPGEIDTIILNLLTNSIYWLKRHDGERRLRFTLTSNAALRRVTVFVDDSGPGIDPDDTERVFWPGVTRKPNGIGMGLTVAAELVKGHGGSMGTIAPGSLGGATFQFDLPLVRSKLDEVGFDVA